jgi:hypothetical protein
MSSDASELAFLSSIVRLVKCPSLAEGLEQLLDATLVRTGARYGYVEVLNEQTPNATPIWRARARSDEHIDWIQRAISRGIIGQARLEGRMLVTTSAVGDVRFRDCDSVKQHEIGAVLCAPFDGFWTSGVVYLQGATSSADFGPADCDAAELAAAHVGQLADRLRHDAWPSTPLRVEVDALRRHYLLAALARCDWNFSAVERETGLSRKTIRKIVRTGRRDS